jgi:hypothetical protein
MKWMWTVHLEGTRGGNIDFPEKKILKWESPLTYWDSAFVNPKDEMLGAFDFAKS